MYCIYRSWISNVTFRGLCYVQWVMVKDDSSFCWYWWNCWPSLLYCFIIPLLHLPSFRPSQDIFRRIFLSNYWWQKSDIWSQPSYRYPISWQAILDPSDSYFLFADLVGFYTHWTYMCIFRRIFLSNYWWQESDIWSQASYRYAIFLLSYQIRSFVVQ